MMNRSAGVILIAIFTSGLGVSVCAGPAFEVINPTINFGRVTKNKVVTSDAWLKSVGDEPVKIKTLFSGCGCTEIPLPDSTIEPGDSLRLPIRFDTDNMMGRVSKRPTIQTNAGEGVTALNILAEIIVDPGQAWPVVLTPEIADVSQFGEKTRRMDRFWLANQSNEDLRVYVVDTALKSFEIKVPTELKALATIEGKLRVIESQVTADFEESVTFRIEGKETNYYTLPVFRRYRPNAGLGR